MIYFIQNTVTKNIKIGFTANNDISTRMRALNIGNDCDLKCIHLMDGNEQDEYDIHTMFCKDRLRGEWFRPENIVIFLENPVIQRRSICQPQKAPGFIYDESYEAGDTILFDDWIQKIKTGELVFDKHSRGWIES